MGHSRKGTGGNIRKEKKLKEVQIFILKGDFKIFFEEKRQMSETLTFLHLSSSFQSILVAKNVLFPGAKQQVKRRELRFWALTRDRRVSL